MTKKDPLMPGITSSSHSYAKNIWKMDTVPMKKDASLPMDLDNSVKTINTTLSTKQKNVVALKTTTFAYTEIDATSFM